MLARAAVVVDVSKAPACEDAAVTDFFKTATGDLLSPSERALLPGPGARVAQTRFSYWLGRAQR